MRSRIAVEKLTALKPNFAAEGPMRPTSSATRAISSALAPVDLSIDLLPSSMAGQSTRMSE